MQECAGLGWDQLDTPLLLNTDVSPGYIADRSTDSLGVNLEEQHFNSVSFFTPSIFLLSSPGKENVLIICVLHVLEKERCQRKAL